MCCSALANNEFGNRNFVENAIQTVVFDCWKYGIVCGNMSSRLYIANLDGMFFNLAVWMTL